MPRKIKWRHDIHTILSTVRNSKIETWTRANVEWAFCVSRGSAQTIVKAVGDVQDLGGKHVVSRSSLLAYLEAMINADDLHLAHKTRLDTYEPVPKVKGLQIKVPDDLRTIMVRDLPPEVTLEPGRIEILGANSEMLVERLLLLAMALQNDLETAAQRMDPPRRHSERIDDELRAMFQDLAEREQRAAVSNGAPYRSSVCTAEKIAAD
ncbi:hypothetical protein [Edaphobacter modestus]|uniref:Uncharacterized protein n=1 Tax=Edaphobacter modestus TaxID=388466 RepID=A0A4V2G1F3_9BACT|nr:hypothetical protein [Edaphobacter modestus]RZU29056.1 hypothetical protein BDD14_6650 [Edaphobacter modestus]